MVLSVSLIPFLNGTSVFNYQCSLIYSLTLFLVSKVSFLDYPLVDLILDQIVIIHWLFFIVTARVFVLF